MIPTKDKNVLLLPVTDGGVTQTFNMPNHDGYNSSKPVHNGLDLGWTSNKYCNLLACQEGTVVDTYKNNSSFGNGIVLQHDYADGTHRWTGYVHQKEAPTLKVGTIVKQGDVIGIRGGSPYVNGKAKYGVHLHLYCTACTTAPYTWNTMKANVINPFPLLYKSKKVKYDVLAKSESAMMNGLKYLEDIVPEVVKPVDRNPSENQLLEKSSVLRVRMKPSLQGTVIGYLKANVYYNYYDTVKADGYQWHKIADEQWVAQTGSMVVYPKQTEVDILKGQINSLQLEITDLRNVLNETKSNLVRITNENDLLSSKIAGIKSIIAD